MTLTIESIKDVILNAITAGMSYDDAVLLALPDEEQEKALTEDKEFQRKCRNRTAYLEKELLGVLRDTIEVQASKGRDHGVTWLLSKINPKRYGGGDDGHVENAGSIVINTQHVDMKDPDSCVEIYDGKQ